MFNVFWQKDDDDTPVRLTDPVDRHKYLRTVIAWMPVFICFLAVMYYCFVTEWYKFHSDAAYSQIWAQEIIHSKRLLSDDFNYAEPRQTFNFHFLLIPWLLFKEASFFNHAMMQAIFAAIFFAAYIAFCRKVGASLNAIILSTAFVMSIPYYPWLDMVWGQMAYGAECFFTLVIFMCGYDCLVWFEKEPAELLSAPGRQNTFFSIMASRRSLLFIAIIALISMNGMRIYIWHFAPVFLGIVAGYFLNKIFPANKTLSKHATVIACAVMLAGLAIGCLLFWAVTRGIAFPHSTRAFLSMTSLKNLAQGVDLPKIIAHLFYGDAIYSSVLSVALVLIPLFALFTLPENKSLAMRILLPMSFAATCAVIPYLLMRGDLFTTVMNGAKRYFIPAWFVSLMILPLLLDQVVASLGKSGRKIIVFAMLAICCSNFYLMNDYKIAADYLAGARTVFYEEPEEVKLTRQAGVKYAYATFWNAAKGTVLSGGDVIIRPILVSKTGIVSKMTPYHNADRWYEPNPDIKKSALILSKAEIADSSHIGILDEAVQSLESANFKIYIFDFNVAEKLHSQIYTSAALPYLTGRDQQDGGRIAQEGVDLPGFISHGPYLSLSARSKAKYKATVTYSSSLDANTIAAYTDVHLYDPAAGASVILDKWDINGTNGEKVSIDLFFEYTALYKQGLVEVRNNWNGSGDFVFYALQIQAM